VGVSKLSKMALLVAVAVVFSFVPGFPMIPIVEFVRYEFSDLPILVCSLAFGAVPGVLASALSVLLSFLLGAEGGGPYGALMHFIAIGGYALAAGLVYSRKKTRAGAIIGMATGTILMTLLMIPANLIITPLYTGAPLSAVKALLIPGLIPVNIVKGVITAVLTFILYKRVSGFLHAEGFGDKKKLQ
jgi:riboflavin transporter FmnP